MIGREGFSIVNAARNRQHGLQYTETKDDLNSVIDLRGKRGVEFRGESVEKGYQMLISNYTNSICRYVSVL
jgi:hypothetical protein